MINSEDRLNDRIYNLVCGYQDLKVLPIPEVATVKNKFERGSLCENAYNRMLDAYSRICQRLDGTIQM